MGLSCKELSEWLGSYPSLKMQAESFNEQLARMKSAEEFPSMEKGKVESKGGTGEKGIGPPDPMGAAVSRRVDLERKMADTVEERNREMAAIENAILMLPDSMHQLCLWLRYIDVDSCDPTPWKAVAMKIYRKDDEAKVRTTQNIHGAALLSLVKRMQEVGINSTERIKNYHE